MASSELDIGTACRDSEFSNEWSKSSSVSQEAKADGVDVFRDHEGNKSTFSGLPTPKKLFPSKESSHDDKDNSWAYGCDSNILPIGHKKTSHSNKSVGKDKTAVSPPNPIPSDSFSGFLDNLLSSTVSKAIEQTTSSIEKEASIVEKLFPKTLVDMPAFSGAHDQSPATESSAEAAEGWPSSWFMPSFLQNSLLGTQPVKNTAPPGNPTVATGGLKPSSADSAILPSPPATASPSSTASSQQFKVFLNKSTMSASCPASKSSPPTPPRYPPGSSRQSYAEKRPPLFLFQCIVKRMSLLAPGASSMEEAKPEIFFEMLNKACALRHINPRSSSAVCEVDQSGDSGKDGESQPHKATAESTLLGECAHVGMAAAASPPSRQGEDDLSKVIAWMSDSERRHERTTAVLRCCLEFFALYQSSRDGQNHRLSADDILSSSMLPLLEENLAVGIEDMENEASLFRHTISLIYQLSQMGEDSSKLLGPLGKQWKPAQRRSLMHMCDDVDKLVAEYLEGVGHTECVEAGNHGHSESFFEMVRYVASCVRQACSQASASQANATQDSEAAATADFSSQGKVPTWRTLPSVITWVSGEVSTVDEAALDERYEKEMSAHKLEGLEGVRDSHYWKSYGTGKVMPTRMARKVMQELVALRRDLPLNRREGVVLRYDEERADFIKIVIFGSEDTPYAAGCFEYHIYCPPTYPDVAPSVWLMTTGNGRVRFNPNLYEDGLVCSSLLNQGSGWGHVTWRSGESNLLEVCKSIMWVHMNADVYFAEPDQEDLIGTAEGDIANEAYCDIVRYGNVKYAMVGQLQRPSPGFEEAIRTHFRLRKVEILAMVEGWLQTARSGCIGGPRTTRRRAIGKQDVGYLHIKPVTGLEEEADNDDDCDDEDEDEDEEGIDDEDEDEEDDEEEEEEEDCDDEEDYDGNDDDDDDASIDAEAQEIQCNSSGDTKPEPDPAGAYKEVSSSASSSTPTASAGIIPSLAAGGQITPEKELCASIESAVAGKIITSDLYYHCVPGAGVVKISADLVHYHNDAESKVSVSEVQSTVACAAAGCLALSHAHAEPHSSAVPQVGAKPNTRPQQKRVPLPNYRAEFVQSHNPDLADRFDMGFYAKDLERAIQDLRNELAKL